ncbi:hypothetical protein [Acinetobacter sp. NIPH 2699]|uniref:hypothetical protein n=1 Tax=Acinetobacter sp. NIPH 2699 TaxID=2923433 RepID=UPI001F4A803B|nr:hypothetical protein [Acinetobacter sp. NIPH 2699]MCH7336187.1 hypothetical protein [Acinetobacter sp. NIPH 2699]
MTLQQDLALHANARLVQVYIDRMVLIYPEKSQQITMSAQFSHPRSSLGDYFVAESLVSNLVHQTISNAVTVPYLFIQIMERTEAGLTLVEIRAWQELGLSSGARVVAIYDEMGNSLTSDNLALAQKAQTKLYIWIVVFIVISLTLYLYQS